jgi:hypothetical protein
VLKYHIGGKMITLAIYIIAAVVIAFGIAAALWSAFMLFCAGCAVVDGVGKIVRGEVE